MQSVAGFLSILMDNYKVGRGGCEGCVRMEGCVKIEGVCEDGGCV